MMTPSLAGRLLIATPVLEDPNFERTVVYMCFHDEKGAFGLVINRPQEMRAADAALEGAGVASHPAALFSGGPVEPSAILGLARMREGTPVEWWTQIRDGVGLLNLAVSTIEAMSAVLALRVFHGYAGWRPGQLEGEIVEEAWFVADAAPDDPFTDDPGTLWQRVLRRQHGPMAMYGWYPEDPSVN